MGRVSRLLPLKAAAVALTAIGMTVSVSGSAAEPTPPAEGLQFVADNVATAAAAAASAPLSPVAVLDPNGAPTGLTVNLPPEFGIAQLATRLKAPRFMAFDDVGNLVVAAAGAGSVYRYPYAQGAVTPTTDVPRALVSGLDAPSSVAFFGGYLYVGETTAISRFAYDPAGEPGAREVVVPDLPVGGHNTRTVAFDPTDGAMYVAIGSSCNICDERDSRRASVQRYAADGSGGSRFAFGLRNPVGLAFQPGTGVLWATVNERDNQGNEIPPDLVTVVRQGQNFGWPGCQPPSAVPQDSAHDCSTVTPPTVGLQAHGAPLGLAFAGGQQLPADYANDLFVVQHGSWNRTPPAEPKVVRLHFDGYTPVAAMDFLTGFQSADGARWGRPAGIAVAPDGALIVSDDQSGTLYRISYSPH